MTSVMAAPLQLPCVRCGNPATAGPVGSLPVCAFCQGLTAAGGGTYLLRHGAQRLALDAAGIISRLRSQELTGDDPISDDDQTWRPLAAHPDFRTYFLPGSPNLILPPEKVRKPIPRSVVRLAGLLAAVVLGAVLYEWGPPLPPLPALGIPGIDALTARLSETSTSVIGQAEADAIVTVKPTPDGPIDALVARVGAVPEARHLLLGRAWTARYAGGKAALEEATQLAERAVARAEDDPAALALLAELYAEAGTEPVLRRALVARARTVGPSSADVKRAVAAVALADGKPQDAAAPLAECAPAPGVALACRWWRALALASAPAEQLQALDALAAEWPQNLEVGRRAALVAAALDAPTAPARVARAMRGIRKDRELESARAVLLFRDGDLAGGEAAAKAVPDPLPPGLAALAAQSAILRSTGKDALWWVGRAGADPSGSADDIFALRLAQAQAAWRDAAAGSAGGVQAAMDSSAAVVALRRTDPMAAQVRAMAATLANSDSEATSAWERADPRGSSGRDVARALLSRAVWHDRRHQPMEAEGALDNALQADPYSPAVYLWRASLQLSRHNPGGAMEALSQAVRRVDGVDARRNPLGGALAVPGPWQELRQNLDTTVGQDATLGGRARVARATAAWLGGEPGTALADLAEELRDNDDADAWALAARCQLARGDAAAALAAIEKVTRVRPKEAAWQMLRAEALVELGQFDAAEGALGVVLSSAIPTPSYGVYAARVALAKGDKDRARTLLETVSRTEPRDLVVRRLRRELEGA
jgi:tetratricopeptide (TPR) repeat protein